MNVKKIMPCAMLAAIGAYFGELAMPALVLAFLMFSDYLTGLCRAWLSETLSSRTGIRGIFKKVAYLFVVGVAISLDFLLKLAGKKVGITTESSYFFGLLVIVWLSVNESISVLENVAAMGVPIPTFLRPLLKHLKQATEHKGGSESEKS